MIAVHGLGTTRAHPMNVMPFLHRQSLPVLDLASGATREPRARRRRRPLRRLRMARRRQAAIRFALRHGARNVIVHGWSTGATMALYAAVESPLRDRISGIVLDSPVLDWQATLRALGAARGVPAALLPLAVRAAGPDRPEEGASVLETSGTGHPGHPDSDPARARRHDRPLGALRELAARRPELVALHAVPQAPHASMWNADPARYEETLRRFLTPQMPADRGELSPLSSRRGNLSRTGETPSVWAFGPSGARPLP
ncbi:prolyl oligopeptidase family serine peptidase [Streptomyces californicus]